MPNKTVLLVDDDPDAFFFVRFALKHLPQPPNLQYVADGFQAMQYLRGHRHFADHLTFPPADLILLDLKMPLMDGFELLEWIRAQPGLALVPVIIVTGSTYQPEASRALQLGADAVLIKVTEFLEFQQSLNNLLERFLTAPTPAPVSAQAV